MINLFALIFYAIYLPFKIGFLLRFDNYFQNNFMFDLIPLIIFIIDFFITLNTAIYSHGFLIINKITLLKHYIHTEFFIDFVSVCSISINLYIYESFIEIFCFLRILKLMKHYHKMEIYLHLSDKLRGIIIIS